MPFNALVFGLGLVGGAIAELLKWYQLRESTNLPEYRKSPLYWGVTVVMVLVGGLLAWAYGIHSSEPLLAINVGISAPLILKSLVAAVPAQLAGQKDLPADTPLSVPRASLVNFIAGR